MNGPPPTAHAGVVTRGLAAMVDAVAVAALAVLLDLTAAGVRFVWSPADFRWPQVHVLGSVAALLVIAVVYLTVAWAMTGRTYGGKLVGVRVLSVGHGLLGWTRSALRALTCVLWPVGLLWSCISPSRRSLQDIVCRSVVVYDAHPYVSIGNAGSETVPNPARNAS
ncbi:MAG: RDD family protein [Blastococcus sp.]